MRTIFLCLLTSSVALTASAQEFEVVSVKPNKTADNSSHSHSDQGRLTATNLSLRQMIVMAYGIKDYQVEGPAWIGTEHFDVAAKFPEALPKDPEKYNAAFTAMMQKMLLDRFKLAVHHDQKTFAVYGLVVTKSGIKFKEAPAGDGHSSNSKNTHYTGKAVSMETFAAFLSRRQDLPVLDMTGLKGFYDLTLDWFPEPKPSEDKPSEDKPAQDKPAGPTLPDALQNQLGLKLENRKAPIEIVIVDHAEKLPTEN
jgi:uncharacterized protein (TIGR03435 family)